MLPWKIWIDTGGTFTDCLALDPEHQLHRLKVLSNAALRGKILRTVAGKKHLVDVRWPVAEDIYAGYQVEILSGKKQVAKVVAVDTQQGILELDRAIRGRVTDVTIELRTGEEVPVVAARLLTKTAIGKKFPAIEMKLGSTRGTNAILERKGAKTALLITKGFKDLLVIGNQQRPDLFALQIVKPAPLYDLVAEVMERIDSKGAVLQSIDDQEVNSIIDLLRKKKIESVAVVLLNSYQNSSHERFLKERLKRAGFSFVSLSTELSTQVRLLPRAETTVANAYLAPIIHAYLQNIQRGLSNASLKIMSSAGSLLSVDTFLPKDSLLSGPAGGVVGAATTAARSGVHKLITFDMGGTSTDVSLYNQRYDYRFEAQVGNLKILSPSLAIETIAAGGGSVCDFDGYRFTVGPASAGAFPGPACYGAGGPLTITDVNLLLGKIDPKLFAIPLSTEKAQQALDQLCRKVKTTTRKVPTQKQILNALTQIANEKMAEAIRKVSTQLGHNPADFTLLSFGGAGGQHACELASMLQMKNVLIPYDAGLLSAYGIGHAKVERFREQGILQPLNEYDQQLTPTIEILFRQGREDLKREGYPSAQIKFDRALLFLRFRGQETSVEIELIQPNTAIEQVRAQFRIKYESIYGHWLESREIEIESIRVIAAVMSDPIENSLSTSRTYRPKPVHRTSAYATFRWEELTAGATIEGPALVVSNNSTTVVEAGWRFVLDSNNNALLTAKKKAVGTTRHVEEAELELFTNRFTAVAQEMGALLQRTSFSVNVKERLDFSCAVLDADGFLVVNAPHIPVHLGSMGVCVREVMKQIQMDEGDVVITNHPAFGGSHLPDVTLIKPVYFRKKRIGFVANRAHHAEIGGRKPGSMPANASTLEEEGVIIKPTYLIRKNKARWDAIRALFSDGKYPTRLWEENQADLNGALAAVVYGEKALLELCEKYSVANVTGYMRRLREHASSLLSQSLRKLPNKIFRAEERLDDGSLLKVKITKRGKLRIDFSGSAAVHSGNLNATRAIVQSVVLYVLRLLVNRPVPMNEGLMDQVIVTLPTGLLNPDFSIAPQPAVVGGNTEVSQRLTDTLLKAFGLAACSQGTMNNFLFGNERFGYYETICGGTGAGPGFDGASAVHQHMTNTRITDPELLELRYPIRLIRFVVRKNSGGKGKWTGGDGVIREFQFLETLEINILSQHRKEKPYGLKEGMPGKIGAQHVVRKEGVIEALRGMDSTKVAPGDRLIIETPGGGGFGAR